MPSTFDLSDTVKSPPKPDETGIQTFDLSDLSLRQTPEETGFLAEFGRGVVEPLRAMIKAPTLATSSDDELGTVLAKEYGIRKNREAPGIGGKAGGILGGLVGSFGQFAGAETAGTFIASETGPAAPLVGLGAAAASFGATGAYESFLDAGIKALDQGRPLDEAVRIGKQVSKFGGAVGAATAVAIPGVTGAAIKQSLAIKGAQAAADRALAGLAPKTAQAVAQVAETAGSRTLKMAAGGAAVGAGGRLSENVAEQEAGLDTSTTEGMVENAIIMAALPVLLNARALYRQARDLEGRGDTQGAAQARQQADQIAKATLPATQPISPAPVAQAAVEPSTTGEKYAQTVRSDQAALEAARIQPQGGQDVGGENIQRPTPRPPDEAAPKEKVTPIADYRAAVRLKPTPENPEGELLVGNKGDKHEDITPGIDKNAIDRTAFVDINNPKVEISRQQMAEILEAQGQPAEIKPATATAPAEAHSDDLNKAQEKAAVPQGTQAAALSPTEQLYKEAEETKAKTQKEWPPVYEQIVKASRLSRAELDALHIPHPSEITHPSEVARLSDDLARNYPGGRFNKLYDRIAGEGKTGKFFWGGTADHPEIGFDPDVPGGSPDAAAASEAFNAVNAIRKVFGYDPLPDVFGLGTARPAVAKSATVEPAAPPPAEPTAGKAPHPDIRLFSELVANTREFNQKRVSKARKTEIIERQKELRKELLRKGYSSDDIHGVEMGEREMPAAPAPPTPEPKAETEKPVNEMSLGEVNEELGKINAELKDLGKGFVTGANAEAMRAPLRERQTRLFVRKQLLEKQTPPEPAKAGAGEGARIGAMRQQVANLEAAIEKDKDNPRLTQLQGERIKKRDYWKARIAKEEAAQKPAPAEPQAPAKEGEKTVAGLTPTENARLKELSAKVDAGTQSPKEAKEWQALVAKTKPPEESPPQISAGPGAQTSGEKPPAAIAELTRRLQATESTGVQERLSARQKIADAWAEGKSAAARIIGSLRAISETVKETARGARTPTDLDRRMGELDFALQKSSAQSIIAGREIRRQQRNVTDRNAIAIYNDAGGNEQAIRDTLANLPANTKPSIRRALEKAANFTPEQKQFAADVDSFFAVRANDAIESDVFDKALEDYYTHIWEKPENMPDEVRAAISNGKVNQYFRFARQRRIPTFLEGILAGKTPVLDPADVIPYYNYMLDRAIASRKFIYDVTENVTEKDGRPALAPTGTAKVLEGDEATGKKGALIIKPRARGEGTRDYRLIDHPAMRKWVWGGTDANGNPVLYQSDLAVHPDAYERLSRIMDRGRLTPTRWGRAALRASTEVKAFKLSAIPSLFHIVHTGSHEVWHWSNPIKAVMTPIDWESPEVKFAVEKGHLKLAPDPAELQIAAEGILGQGLVNKVPFIGPLSKAFSEYMFGEAIPRMKMQTFRDALPRNLKWDAGKLAPEETAARVGDALNNAFGELNHMFLGKYGRDPRFARLLRGIFLAPDFGEARLRFAEKAFTRFGNEERLALATMFVGMYSTARVANMLANGDPQWDWKNMFRVKYGNEWFSMRSVLGDVVNLASNSGRFMYARLNPLYSRTIADWVFKRDISGRKLSGADIVLKRPLQQLVPIQFGALTRDDQRLWESFITSMGVQAREERPEQEVHQLARDWMKAGKDPATKAEYERRRQELFSPSDYEPMRRALRENNMDKARAAYDELLQKGKKPSAISTAMHTLRPFTGQNARELKFKADLTPSGRKVYDAAVAERRELFVRFQKMLAERAKKKTAP
jgi:hypothetical protein